MIRRERRDGGEGEERGLRKEAERGLRKGAERGYRDREKRDKRQSCQVSRIRRDSHTLANTLTLSRLTCRNVVKSHT